MAAFANSKRDSVKPAYECRVMLCPEEVGGFSIHALDLPGVVSQGETEKEAIDNIVDAFTGVIAAYKDAGSPVPWGPVTVEDVPSGARELRVLVNA